MNIERKSRSRPSVMMLGTFGLRPKATLRARALGIAASLSQRWDFALTTTPWDFPADRGKRLIDAGIPIVNTRTATPLLFPLAVREMIHETSRRHSELVHLFKPKGFGDIAARRLSHRLPVVVDMDDWEGDGGWNEIGGYGPLQRRVFDWQERTWPRKALAVTVASRELERRALRLGAPDGAVFYVPNGLTRERFNSLTTAPLDGVPDPIRRLLQGRRVVLLYTRFVEFSPRTALGVIQGVRRAVPDATLLVVGASADKQAEEEIQAQLKRDGDVDSVVFAGWTEPEVIPSLLKLAEVAIHPFDDNLVNRSKCSVKLLELMAAGAPVVTNEVGENGAMIEDGTSGLLVPPNDVVGMVRATCALLNDRPRAIDLGQNARRRVESEFLWERLSLRVEQAYRYALERR